MLFTVSWEITNMSTTVRINTSCLCIQKYKHWKALIKFLIFKILYRYIDIANKILNIKNFIITLTYHILTYIKRNLNNF
jgi:hypothetical protein